MAMLNAARKARIQPYLDADGALEQAAVLMRKHHHLCALPF
jgi:hypothetical protein